jgi:hypothetical protein
MKYVLPLVGVLLVLSLAACGGSQFKQAASTNPQVQQDVNQTETIVKSCVTKSPSLSAIATCVAPKGHLKALEGCLKSASKHDVFHHTRLFKDYSECVVANR